MTVGVDHDDRLGPNVWKVVCVAAIGSFMAQLDATVVNVSLASLAVEESKCGSWPLSGTPASAAIIALHVEPSPVHPGTVPAGTDGKRRSARDEGIPWPDPISR